MRLIDLATEMMEKYNREMPIVFNTIQLYRHDRLEFLKKSHEVAKKGGYILAVKLVRGAYMEKERERAKEMGYPSPIHPDKDATDRDFDAALIIVWKILMKLLLLPERTTKKAFRILRRK